MSRLCAARLGNEAEAIAALRRALTPSRTSEARVYSGEFLYDSVTLRRLAEFEKTTAEINGRAWHLAPHGARSQRMQSKTMTGVESGEDRLASWR